MELATIDSKIENPYFADAEYEVLPSFCEKTKTGKVILNDTKYIDFLEKYGFRTVRIDDVIKFVRIKENIIFKIIPADIKRFVINYAKDYESLEVNNYLLRTKAFFKSDYLNVLKEEMPNVIRDTKDKAFFFYPEGIIEVTSTEIKKPVPYNQNKHLIWEDKIKKRNFRHEAINEIADSIFFDFLCKLTNNDQSRINHIFSIIGYALHNYRTPSNTRAIILNDEVVSDSPEGGNGKSLLITSLGHIRSLVIKNGKNFRPDKSFEWSDINESTDLVLIDETSEGFSFENLFSIITSGFEVEKKNIDKYRLPIEKSPLIIITTNKIIQGYSGSYKRRQYSVDISNYFSNTHTPIDEYGAPFFIEWDEEEWARFDALMLYCVQYYLANGVIENTESQSRKKDAIRATNEIFYGWFEEAKDDFQNFISTNKAMDKYLEETGQRGLKLSAKKFLGLIKSVCKIFEYAFHEERTSSERGFWLQLNSSNK